MNQSFALFVSANTEPEQVRKQEQAQRGLRWSLVRTLLVAALLVIMVFLALTQRDVVEVWVAYLGTADYAPLTRGTAPARANRSPAAPAAPGRGCCRATPAPS